jgi:hypothetical protein
MEPIFKTSSTVGPVAACAITGLALYVTRGVLDQTVTANGIVRFAMLPPWQALVGFICFGGLLLVGIDQLNAPRGTTTGRTRPRLGELVLPLLSLVVLLVPYTPILPDRWPVLQALAGPLGAIVWLAVAALQVWTLWHSRLLTARGARAVMLPDRGRDRAMEPHIDHHRALHGDDGRRGARGAETDGHVALSVRR